MPSTRRSLILGIISPVPLLSGYTYFDYNTTTVSGIDVELVNNTDKDHVFHVAIETSNGLQEWVSQNVRSEAGKILPIEPPQNEDLIAIHGFVDGQSFSGEVNDLDSSDECIHAIVEYGDTVGNPTLVYRASDDC